MFVEAVIAAAIVAMMVGVALQAVSDGARRARGLEARRHALLVAQSELSAVGGEIPLEVGETAGIAGAQVWRVEISPYESPAGASATGRLLQVRVTVRAPGGGGELARLETLRLGAAA